MVECFCYIKSMHVAHAGHWNKDCAKTKNKHDTHGTARSYSER